MGARRQKGKRSILRLQSRYHQCENHSCVTVLDGNSHSSTRLTMHALKKYLAYARATQLCDFHVRRVITSKSHNFNFNAKRQIVMKEHQTRIANSRLEMLPAETEQMVMSVLPNIPCLKSAALTCSSFYDAFKGAEVLIITQVLESEVAPEIMPEAIAVQENISSKLYD